MRWGVGARLRGCAGAAGRGCVLGAQKTLRAPGRRGARGVSCPKCFCKNRDKRARGARTPPKKWKDKRTARGAWGARVCKSGHCVTPPFPLGSLPLAAGVGVDCFKCWGGRGAGA